MMLHPPNLALVLASLLTTAALVWASLFALQLLRHWSLASGEDLQIALERRTSLVSTVLGMVMLIKLVSLLLFVFNTDRMAPLFVGAMCAVGTLNASPYGFSALFALIAVFFCAFLWLVLDKIDAKGRDYPLTHLKYQWLIAMLPLALAETALVIAYFRDLKADTLTSCCGSVFSDKTESVVADLASLSPQTALILLAVAGVMAMVSGILALHSSIAQRLHGFTSLMMFLASIVALISTIALYIYEHPHHYCPFCLLKHEYHYIGFLLYAPLFVGTAAGLAVGLMGWMQVPASVEENWPALVRDYSLLSLAGFAAFIGLSVVAVWRSPLKLNVGLL